MLKRAAGPAKQQARLEIVRLVSFIVKLHLEMNAKVQPAPTLFGQLQGVLPAKNVVFKRLAGRLDQAGGDGSGPKIRNPVFKLKLMMLKVILPRIAIQGLVANDLQLGLALLDEGRIDLHVGEIGRGLRG